uniref:Uncharacterized protein n=1 Tax=Glossina pallidipes TaxID=7398 RepID=A0A1A9ZNB2_GLOPL
MHACTHIASSGVSELCAIAGSNRPVGGGSGGVNNNYVTPDYFASNNDDDADDDTADDALRCSKPQATKKKQKKKIKTKIERIEDQPSSRESYNNSVQQRVDDLAQSLASVKRFTVVTSGRSAVQRSSGSDTP